MLLTLKSSTVFGHKHKLIDQHKIHMYNYIFSSPVGTIITFKGLSLIIIYIICSNVWLYTQSLMACVVSLQFSQKRFTIVRQFKEILQLHDDLISSMFVETGNVAMMLQL